MAEYEVELRTHLEDTVEAESEEEALRQLEETKLNELPLTIERVEEVNE